MKALFRALFGDLATLERRPKRRKGVSWTPLDFGDRGNLSLGSPVYLQEPGRNWAGMVPGLQRNSVMMAPPMAEAAAVVVVLVYGVRVMVPPEAPPSSVSVAAVTVITPSALVVTLRTN